MRVSGGFSATAPGGILLQGGRSPNCSDVDLCLAAEEPVLRLRCRSASPQLLSHHIQDRDPIAPRRSMTENAFSSSQQAAGRVSAAVLFTPASGVGQRVLASNGRRGGGDVPASGQNLATEHHASSSPVLPDSRNLTPVGRPPRSPQLNSFARAALGWVETPKSFTETTSSPCLKYCFMQHWPSSQLLLEMNNLAVELSSLWDAMGASDKHRLEDVGSILRPAIDELGARIQAWRYRRTELEAKCASVFSEGEVLVEELGGQFSDKLAAAAEVPLHSRLGSLENVLHEISVRHAMIQRLRSQVVDAYAVLGRTHWANDLSDTTSLEKHVIDLQRMIDHRQLQAKQVSEGLHQIWSELEVHPSEGSDAAIFRNPQFGVKDAEHTILLESLTHWETERDRRRSAMLELHGRIRQLATVSLEGEQIQLLEAFLSGHRECKDLNACKEKESELESHLKDRMCGLQEQRTAALCALGIERDPPTNDNPVELARLLIAEVRSFEEQLTELRRSAFQDAHCTRLILEELGEQPREGHDDHVQFILANVEDSMNISATIANGVHTSREYWEVKRVEATSERDNLHDLLRGWGADEDIESFLSGHHGFSREDRMACQAKLLELQAAVRAEDEPQREKLRHLYNVTGADEAVLDSFLASLDQAASANARARSLEDELERMEKYFESVRSIITKLDDLKALVVEGARFESVAQAGDNRFSGNSLHFLEEEKFRKMFAKRYPALRDSLIETIAAWEESCVKVFVYHGKEVRAQLLAMRDAEVEMVRAPGDLSVVGRLLQLLDVNAVSVADRPPRAGSQRRCSRVNVSSENSSPPARQGSRANSRPARGPSPATNSRNQSPVPSTASSAGQPRPPRNTLASQGKFC